VSSLEQANERIRLLEEENANLRAQIGWLKQKLFGGGQSERLDRAQLQLALGELEKLADAVVETTKLISYERARATEKRPVAAEVFAKLPVMETVVVEPEEVKVQPEAFERIGEERTFEVDVVPPKLFKREIIRPKYRVKADRMLPPVVAPAPARVVQGGYASAGLLAWVALSKYVDHLPLYRLEQMSARWGAQISRQTMADWIRMTAECLEPLYKYMHRGLLAGGYIQADETPIKCNDPDEKRGGTSQGYLWVISRPGGDVVFDWRLSRCHGELTTLLTENYKGVLQSDGYEAYASYARRHEGVVWVGCWAHARRKFIEALKGNQKIARVALKLIGRLYTWERTWDQAGVTQAQARAALRAQHFARPLRWLHALASHLIGKKIVLPLLARGQGLHLSAQSVGAVDRACAPWGNPHRQQSGRKLHPAHGDWQKELAFYRPPRRRPTFGDHLYVGRLLPAPRQGSVGLLARRTHAPAAHDQP